MAKSQSEELLELLLRMQERNRLEFSIIVEGKSFFLNEATLSKTTAPVNRPTKRGGIYFSDTYIYKLKGLVHDQSIIPLLSKTMLGPNAEFGEILTKTSINNDSNREEFSLYTNLTNSMQSSSKIELNLVVVRTEKN